jgi:hypothetical protein
MYHPHIPFPAFDRPIAPKKSTWPVELGPFRYRFSAKLGEFSQVPEPTRLVTRGRIGLLYFVRKGRLTSDPPRKYRGIESILSRKRRGMWAFRTFGIWISREGYRQWLDFWDRARNFQGMWWKFQRGKPGETRGKH